MPSNGFRFYTGGHRRVNGFAAIFSSARPPPQAQDQPRTKNPSGCTRRGFREAPDGQDLGARAHAPTDMFLSVLAFPRPNVAILMSHALIVVSGTEPGT